MKSVLESPSQRGAGDLVDPTRFNSWAGRGVASSILPRVKEVTLAARVKMLESKLATVEAQLQKRIDSGSDATASQSFLAVKVQVLEAKDPPKESIVPDQRVSLRSTRWLGSRTRRWSATS